MSDRLSKEAAVPLSCGDAWIDFLVKVVYEKGTTGSVAGDSHRAFDAGWEAAMARCGSPRGSLSPQSPNREAAVYLVVHEDREGRERGVPRTFYTEDSARAFVAREVPAPLPRGEAVVLYELRTKDILREGA